jgi:hypothetical protein
MTNSPSKIGPLHVPTPIKQTSDPSIKGKYIYAIYRSLNSDKHFWIALHIFDNTKTTFFFFFDKKEDFIKKSVKCPKYTGSIQRNNPASPQKQRKAPKTQKKNKGKPPRLDCFFPYTLPLILAIFFIFYFFSLFLFC